MAITIDQVVSAVNATFSDEAAMLAAFSKLMVLHQQFATVEETGIALQLLDARMDVEIANGAARLAQHAGDVATAQAQTAIQQAQANAIAAQQRFDTIVATLAG
jgi:hypothetical protein